MKNELITPDQLAQQMADSWAAALAKAEVEAASPPVYVQMWNVETKQYDRVVW